MNRLLSFNPEPFETESEMEGASQMQNIARSGFGQQCECQQASARGRSQYFRGTSAASRAGYLPAFEPEWEISPSIRRRTQPRPTPSVSQTPSLLPMFDSQAFRQKIVRIANQELARWGNGAIKETDPRIRRALQDYWKTGVGRSVSDAQLGDPAFQARKENSWSAAFISWVMRTAGAGDAFKRSSAHATYTRAAIDNRLANNNNPFKAYRITELAPQVGDLVCNSRAGSGATYDNIKRGMFTHCDIVTEVRPGSLNVVGGNVNSSVARKTRRTDASGRITEPNYFAVIRIDGKQPSVPPAPPPAPVTVTPAAAGASTTSGFEVDGSATPILACIHGSQLKNRPIKFIARYLRDLTRREARAVSDVGLQIVSCWELGHPTQGTYFTRAQGRIDGGRAFTAAQAIGQPANTPIYFAVDYDAYTNQDQAAVREYFQGVGEAYKNYYTRDATPYAIGAYGSGCVLRWSKARGIASFFWQAFAPGWCNNRLVWAGANLHTFDLDQPQTCHRRLGRLEGWGNEGGWLLPSPSPTSAPTHEVGSVLPLPSPVSAGMPGSGSSAPRLLKQESTPPRTTLYVEIDLQIVDKFRIVAPPMTGIFIPDGYAPGAAVDLILYLHGHKAEALRRQGIDQYWNSQRFPYGALREGVNASGRNVILVAPSLGSHSEAKRLLEPGGLDTYIAQVLAALRAYGPYRRASSAPALGSLIFACHSGGGSPMRQLAGGRDRAVAHIRECWGYDCTYNKGDDAFWAGWARAHPNAKVYIYYIPGAQTAPLAEGLRNRRVQNAIVQPSRDKRHNYVPITHWRERVQGAGFLAARSGPRGPASIWSDGDGRHQEHDQGSIHTVRRR